MNQITNPNQLIGVTRSMERGIIVNMGNQVQVWKRILDILQVNVSHVEPEIAKAFGWKTARGGGVRQPKVSSSGATILPHTCAVIITVPPLVPRAILDQITVVWMEDFGFAHVGFHCTPLVSSCSIRRENPYETACVVDLGWSATHIVSTYKGRLVPGTVRRMSLGARHLIKIWQYHCSYRQWNLMDQEFILRRCLELSGYISMDYKEEMKEAKKWPLGLRACDRDYILPDYQNTFDGRIRIPPSLERRMRQEANQGEEMSEEGGDDSDDESVRAEDMNEEDINDDEEDYAIVQKETKPETEVDSEEEEDEEALRKRLLKERQEEEMRKRRLEAEQQILRMSVERFAIPEGIFRPSDVGLPKEWAGLARSIHQSIQKCPEYLRAAMYRSIYLTGGLSQLENLRDRLESELRTLVPCEYEVVIHTTTNPTTHAWMALKTLVKEQSVDEWSITQTEWANSSRRGGWRRLAVDHGGTNII